MILYDMDHGHPTESQKFQVSLRSDDEDANVEDAQKTSCLSLDSVPGVASQALEGVQEDPL